MWYSTRKCSRRSNVNTSVIKDVKFAVENGGDVTLSVIAPKGDK